MARIHSCPFCLHSPWLFASLQSMNWLFTLPSSILTRLYRINSSHIPIAGNKPLWNYNRHSYSYGVSNDWTETCSGMVELTINFMMILKTDRRTSMHTSILPQIFSKFKWEAHILAHFSLTEQSNFGGRTTRQQASLGGSIKLLEESTD